MDDVIHISRLKRISEKLDPQLPKPSQLPYSQLKQEIQFEIEQVLDNSERSNVFRI